MAANITAVITDYDSAKLNEIVTQLRRSIEDLLASSPDLSDCMVMGRLKDRNSLLVNIHQGKKKLGEFFDLIGLRVIVPTVTQILPTTEFLRDKLEVTDIKDHIGRLREDQFGYRSYHLVAKIPGSCKVPTSVFGSEPRYEIQVRSASDHAWAWSEHKLYKGASLPPDLSRKVHLAAGLLEAADLMMSEAEAGLKDAKERTQKDIVDGKLPAQVNPWTIEQYVLHSATVKALGEELKGDLPPGWEPVISKFGIEMADSLLKILEQTNFDEVDRRLTIALPVVKELACSINSFPKNSGRTNYLAFLLPALFYERTLNTIDGYQPDHLEETQRAGRELLVDLF